MNQTFEIVQNKQIAKNMYKMVLRGDTSRMRAPGQFVNIRLDGFYLRRPISVCDYDGRMLTLLYKVVGKGTAAMAAMEKRQLLELLVGLGNGFDTAKSGRAPLLIGGGAGVPPLYGLARQLRREGKDVMAVLGFNSREDVFYADEFRRLEVPVVLMTADGSAGRRGFVTDGMAGLAYTYFYACGPEGMLRAVYEQTDTSGQLSFEERMGCGFGACMGCSCRTKYGSKRICKDGPVLEKEEIVW